MGFKNVLYRAIRSAHSTGRADRIARSEKWGSKRHLFERVTMPDLTIIKQRILVKNIKGEVPTWCTEYMITVRFFINLS